MGSMEGIKVFYPRLIIYQTSCESIFSHGLHEFARIFLNKSAKIRDIRGKEFDGALVLQTYQEV